jgi:Tol biopolymer transport system component
MKNSWRVTAVGVLLTILPAAGLPRAVAEDAKAEKIVFASYATKEQPPKAVILRMNADGTGRTEITKGEAMDLDPVLSPDGKRIAFTRVDHKTMRADIHVMNADGAEAKPITKIQDKQIAFGPSWSPDGKRIAYSVTAVPEGGPPGNGEIHIIDADGKNGSKVTEGWLPAWSPDGQKLLYTVLEKNGDFNPRLFVADADGKKAKQLLKGRAMMGTFSPDGKRIACMAAKDGPNEQPRIHLCNPDGSNLKQVTTAEQAMELAPRWSADGKRIFFNRMAREGNPLRALIFVMDADGKNEKQLSPDNSMDLLGGAPLLWLTRRQAQQP